MVALGERSLPNGQELLAEFVQYGNQKPFEEIVRRYAGMVFNVCYRITKDKHEAEDATQAVFLTLALQARRGTDIKALGPWLQQVAKRLALDTRRSKKRRQTREERHHVEQTRRQESLLDDALPSADMDELKTILHEELQKLPAKYRMPLILHYFGGLSRDEMAAELNCKPSTLGVRIFRGREMLAGRLSSRGINISMGALAIALGLAVKRAVSESLIASTSYAATAMMRGHDGAGFASAHVIGLTRRASSALTIGKVKLTAVTLLLAGTSLGAGAKVLGIIPQINVRQIITNQIQRLVGPLIGPYSRPLRVDAQTTPTKIDVATATGMASPFDLPASGLHGSSIRRSNSASSPAAVTTAVAIPATLVAQTTPSDSQPASIRKWTSTSTVFSSSSSPAVASADSAKTADLVDASTSGSSTAASGSGGGADAVDLHSSDPLPFKAAIQAIATGWSVTIHTNDLVVGSPAKSLTGSSDSSISSLSAQPASLVAIASLGGSVTQSSAGIVRGWGVVDRTGTLQMDGKVVADGGGVDRTLNLTSFTSVQTGAVSATDSSLSSSTSTPSAATASTNAAASTASITASPSANATPYAAMFAQVGNEAARFKLAFAQNFAANPAQAPVLSSTNAFNVPPALSSSAASSVSAASPVAVSPVVVAPDGWYAINHGRLSLPLIQSPSDPSVLTWGDNPSAASLSLVNSVRIALTTNGAEADTNESAPAVLSLLSTERSDAPDLSQIDGTTIGLWQVDPNGPDLGSADLTVHYDGLLVSELDAAADSVQLWTYGNNTSTWQPVDPATFALDTTNDLVSGYGTDISYFAVSVNANDGCSVEQLVADHLAQFSSGSGEGFGGAHSQVQGVPEPVALPLLLTAGALLGRRRRR